MKVAFWIAGIALYVTACLKFGSEPVLQGLIAGMCMSYALRGR